MHGTHLPLRKWFLAAYMVATHSNGISALQLQPKIGVGYKTAWLLLHKLRRAMVDPDRSRLTGAVEVDETSIPFRKNSDPLTGRQGRSPIGKLFLAGAVEVTEGRYPGRIRLQRILNIDGETLRSFVYRNTEDWTLVVTDANPCYNDMRKRFHFSYNLSEEGAPKAHEVLPWIHRVFSNFKRWTYGTYHGIREKHVDIYCNEFVFRWNRRRHFKTNIDTILGLGQKIGKVNYRDIVGDTRQWKQVRRDQILQMINPKRLAQAYYHAHDTGCDIFDALDDIRKEEHQHTYTRRKPKRPILPPRRTGEGRNTRRYIHPPPLVPAIAGDPPFKHIPRDSMRLMPRRQNPEKAATV